MKTLFVSLEDFNKGVCLSTPILEGNGRTLSTTIISYWSHYTLTITWCLDGYDQKEVDEKTKAVLMLWGLSSKPNIDIELIVSILNS